MGLREDVLAILRLPVTQRIRFSFTTVTGSTIAVDGSTFDRVARAIENGSVSLVGSTSVDSFDAVYQTDSNQLEVAPIRQSRMQEAIIIHEAVHASLDLTRSAVPLIDNEVAAFIAGTIYLRRIGFPRSRYAGTYEESALSVANAIISGQTPTASQLQTLRRALEDDPEYRREFHWGCTVGTQCYYISRGSG